MNEAQYKAFVVWLQTQYDQALLTARTVSAAQTTLRQQGRTNMRLELDFVSATARQVAFGQVMARLSHDA
jgi:hypothetical protein